jgi:hypothetical protein
VWTVKSAGTTGVTTITDGKATPAAAGTLVLTATIAKGKSETEDYTQEFTLTITGTFVPATGITGVPETGLVDQELDLTAVTVTPNDATNKTITWSVQDAGGTGVTTGDLADGKATPTGAGALKVLAVIVKVGANQTDFTNVFTITVSVPFVTVTGITGVPDTGVAGTQIDLTGAEVTPNTATNKTITWTVKDAGTTGLTAGPITGGTVTPATAGTLKLTATVANGTAVGTDYTKDFILTIAAAPVPVTGITGVPDTGVAGTQIDLTGAEVTPANATNKTIKWTVKDMGGTGATITNGKATPSLGGTLVLTATIAKGKADSTDYTQDFSIAIIMPVQGIQNVPTVPGLVGKSINLSGVTVTPDTATNKGITWSVKAPNSTNAAVSGSTVTAASAGTLTLTATVANGKAVGTPYTEDIELVIGTALLLQKTGTTETIVDAVYDGDLDGVFAWINENAEANDKYVVLLGADQAIAPYFSPGDPGTPPNFESTDAGKAGIEITLRGHGAERKISWDGTSKTESQTFGQGLFNLWNNNALILDNNITLDGKNTGLIVGTASYELPMIYMNNAHLTMNTGSKITGVKVPDYGAVTVAGSVTGGIVLAGGEINGNTASYGIQVGNPSLSTNYTFTMTSGAIKNNTGIGLFLRLADGAAAMSGGTISGNKVGIHLIDAVFTMTGGTIRDNTATIGGGIRFVGAANSGAFYLNGNVTIDNNGVALEGSPTAKYNTVIYIGGNFNAVGTIAIDVHSYNESDFTATWGSASGHVFLKGGTADNPTAVTGVQAAKFTAGKACNTSYALSTSGDETEKTGGALSITGLNTDNYGVAKWE